AIPPEAMRRSRTYRPSVGAAGLSGSLDTVVVAGHKHSRTSTRSRVTGISSRGVMPRPCVLIALSLPTAAALAPRPLVLATPSCVRRPPSIPAITSRFVDNFDRGQLGSDWTPTANVWSIQDGHLRVADARNHPIWLRRRLPGNARIEFDAWSNSPHGDLK